MKQFNILLILPCLIAVLLFQMPAYAKEREYCTASIPIEISVLGNSVPSGMEYKVVLKSENETNPMPDIKEITIKENGSAEFGPMTYTEPGKYVYSVYQQAGNAEHFTYDSTIYTVTVSIENDGNGSLKSGIFATKNNSTDKVDKIVFSNSYELVTKPTETITPQKETVLEEPTILKETKPAKETKVPTNSPTGNNTPANAPKTGERIIGAVVVGIVGICMLIMSMVMNKKRKEEK